MIRHHTTRSLAPAWIVAGVCGVALVAVIVGMMVADQRQYLLLAAFGVLPLLVASLRWFNRVVLLVPVFSIFVPLSLATGSGSRVSVVMLVVLMLTGIWVVTAIMERRSYLARSPLNAPLVCFAVVCCLALVWSVVFRDPMLVRYDNFIVVQLAALLTIILSPAAALLIANFVRTPQALSIIAALFLVAGIASILSYVVGVDLRFINTRGLFSMWFVAVAYAFLTLHPGLHILARLVLALLLLVYAYIVGVVNVAWLSGWVPALVAMGAITLFRSRIGFVGFLLVLSLVVVTQRDWLDEHILKEADDDGSYQRLTLWELNLELFKNHPVFGTGPAGYALYYVTYHPAEARSTHNNYLDIVAQTGLIGSICWIWLNIVAVREARIVLKRAPPGPLRTLGFAAAGGLVGATAAMMLGDWILPFAYNQGIEGYRYTMYSWIFLGVLMSIRQLVAPVSQQTTRTP